MKQYLITIVLTMLISMVAKKLWAYDIAVKNENGVTIFYNYINEGQEVEVTYETKSTTATGGTTCSGYEGATSIIIPEKITYMNVTKDVTSIGNCAFWQSDLTSVTIPCSVTIIDNNAFGHCEKLKSVSMGNSVTRIGAAAFYSCSKLTSFTIPISVTEIGSHAFYGCSGLTTISIPSSVKSIGSSAFQSCLKLNYIYLGRNVKTIGSKAFLGIKENATIRSFIETPFDIFNDVFSTHNYNNSILYVPTGTKSKYMDCNGWQKFLSIMEKIDDNPISVTANDISMVYGDMVPELSYVVEGGTLTGIPSLSCEVSPTSSVGTYPISISAGTIANPNVTYTNGTITIKKAPLIISADIYTKKQGEPIPDFALTFSGFKNNEIRSVLTKQPIISCEANEKSAPGEYPVIVSGAEAQNYDITYTAGKLIVTDPVAAQTVTLNKNSISIEIEQSETIIAAIKPDNTFDKTIFWSSSDTIIATVDSIGTVTAKKAGKAIITAKAASNPDAIATCEVTVIQPVEGITLDETSLIIEQFGEMVKLTATILPEDASNKSIKWTSSNPAVCTVSGNGTVIAVGNGTATVIATTEDGDIPATCVVNVKDYIYDTNRDGAIDVADIATIIEAMARGQKSKSARKK